MDDHTRRTIEKLERLFRELEDFARSLPAEECREITEWARANYAITMDRLKSD
jgi:hypothetical protein